MEIASSSHKNSISLLTRLGEARRAAGKLYTTHKEEDKIKNFSLHLHKLCPPLFYHSIKISSYKTKIMQR